MKIARHAKILELIENYDIETQDELAQRLCEEGFVVTQATVSRDIREMKLTKIATEKGRQKYAVITGNDTEVTERLTRVFKEAVLKMDYAQNMIVVKTLDGMGMAVAVALDNMQNSEILGTIAGDDTVFCVVRTHNQAAVIIEKLYRIIIVPKGGGRFMLEHLHIRNVALIKESEKIDLKNLEEGYLHVCEEFPRV